MQNHTVLRERQRSHAESGSRYKERKCADTIGTVLVPWTGYFQR